MDSFVIKSFLITDIQFLNKCILLLHEKQTDEEQAIGDAVEQNMQGFNKPDSFVMSKYAETLLSSGQLTLAEAIDARRRLTKYITQLQNYLPDEQDD